MPIRLSQSNPRPWRPVDVRRMKLFARRSYSAREAGNLLGRTRGAVAYKAMVLGVSFHAIHQPRGVQKRRFRQTSLIRLLRRVFVPS